jgi:AraC-like DNA-binding protein
VPENSPSFGVIFKLGVSMPHIPINMLIDNDVILPRAGSQSFWLKGAAWQFPNYENIDDFVQRLIREDILGHEPLIESTLTGAVADMTTRTLQRRFLRATGITHTAIHQIERARYATLLLKSGISILDTINETGYYDQPHLTRLLKRYIGQTPAQLADENNTEELSFLYKTSLLW